MDHIRTVAPHDFMEGEYVCSCSCGWTSDPRPSRMAPESRSRVEGALLAFAAGDLHVAGLMQRRGAY